MGIDIEVTSHARSRAKALIDQKDNLEKDIREQERILGSQKVGMHEPLVDSEGFPRSDIDVVAVRLARVRLYELKNDHKKLMDEIETALFAVHEEIRKVDEKINPISIKDNSSIPIPSELKPFAKVNRVAPDSPASEAGLKANDLIVQMGSVVSTTTEPLKQIGSAVASSENRPVSIIIQREDGQLERLYLTPRRGWGGIGLLGCHISEFAVQNTSTSSQSLSSSATTVANSDTFTLLYFASARDITATESEQVPLPSSLLTITQLPHLLMDKYPALEGILSNCMFAIDMEYVDKNDASVVIKKNDKVAIIPPVSGG